MNKPYGLFWCLIALIGWGIQCRDIVANPIAFDGRIQDHLQKRLAHTAPPEALHVSGATLNAPELVRQFYQQRFYQPAWSKGTGLQAFTNPFVTTISAMEQEGLEPQVYHLRLLEILSPSVWQPHTTPARLQTAQLADLDILLTDAFLTMASHLIAGRFPEPIDTYKQQEPMLNLIALLQDALNSQTPTAAIQSLLPSHVAYLRLRQALARYRQIAVTGGWPIIPDGPTLKKGLRSDRVVALRTRLRTTGDLTWPMVTARSEFDMHLDTAETLFDEPLEQAVQIVQQRHGLPVDGMVGSQTRVALNVPVQERIRQLALNMERWRRNSRALGERYVLVNIPDYTLEVVNNGQSEIRMRVVVGKPIWRTPVFQSTMTYLVVNPYWFVPPGITKREVLPQVRKDPMYLQNQNMEVLDGWGTTARTVDPSQIDWNQITTHRLPYRFRQRPGPNNALGRIKFKFPNPYHVYLHDTPARDLFAKPTRAFSHGCIRVERPLELALYLLQDNPIWTLEHLQKIIQGGTQRYINLSQPIDVHIVYQTAWVDNNETVQFRHDIYSYDNL